MPSLGSKHPPATPSSVSESDDEFLRVTAFAPESIDDETPPADKDKKEAAEASELFPPELIANALRPTFNAVFNGVAKVRGDHWKLEKFEEDGLVMGWTPILQIMLAKLGNSEQAMLILAIGSTAAIVAGKVALDATKPASSTVSIKTPESGASSASSGGATAAKPTVAEDLFPLQSAA